MRPASQEDTKLRYMPVQQNIADPNVMMTFLWKGGEADSYHRSAGPRGDAVRRVDRNGGGSIRGDVQAEGQLCGHDRAGEHSLVHETSGFHAIRPVVKLANGNLLVRDLTFESMTKLSLHEFSLLNIRWIQLDPEHVLTVPPGQASGNPNTGIWVTNPDLSKIDEIGFADLIPGSGHGQGGYIQLGGIEVYGKTVAR